MDDLSKMAQDAVEQAETMAGFANARARPNICRLHGWTQQNIRRQPCAFTAPTHLRVKEIAAAESALAEKIHPELVYRAEVVLWPCAKKWRRTVEDVLSREPRAALGARARIEAGACGGGSSWRRELARRSLEEEGRRGL